MPKIRSPTIFVLFIIIKGAGVELSGELLRELMSGGGQCRSM